MKNKGFTLIEMLVVLAIVGILSAMILSSLGPARSKGVDTRVINGINQIMAVAEAKFTDNKFPDSTDTEISNLIVDIKKYNGGVNVTYNKENDKLLVYSDLASGGGYCADSVGHRKTYTSKQTIATSTYVCP